MRQVARIHTLALTADEKVERVKSKQYLVLGTPCQACHSLEQSQEEFYFSLPLETMDLCLYAKNHGVATSEVASVTGLSVEQVQRVYAMINSKLSSTQYLHLPPQLIEKVDEVHSDTVG